MELRNRVQASKGTKKVGAERGSSQRCRKRHDRRKPTRDETASARVQEEGRGPVKAKVEATWHTTKCQQHSQKEGAKSAHQETAMKMQKRVLASKMSSI